MSDVTSPNETIPRGDEAPQFWSNVAFGGLYGAAAVMLSSGLIFIQFATADRSGDYLELGIWGFILIYSIVGTAVMGFGLGAVSGAIFYGVFWSLQRDADPDVLLRALKRQSRLISLGIQATLIALFTGAAIAVNTGLGTTLELITLPAIFVIAAVHLFPSRKKKNATAANEQRPTELPAWLKENESS